MAFELRGMQVAILVANGFEQIELLEPRRVLDTLGASTEVISPMAGSVWGWDFNDWGAPVPVDACVAEADWQRYDALLLPGGLMSADALRIDADALAFVRNIAHASRPIATLSHGAWTLVDARVVHGRLLTSAQSLRRDLENAGAQWVDMPVVYDRGLVSSRWPSDIPVFEQMLIKTLVDARTCHASLPICGTSNPVRAEAVP